MLDRYPHPDPDYLRNLAMRDPIALQQCVRGWRHGYLGAMVAALVLVVWRQIWRWFRARIHPTTSL